MSVVRGAAVFAAILVFVPVVARAQSLGEIAAKERQRREAAQKKPPTKVFTEDDLTNDKNAKSGFSAPGGKEAAPEAAETDAGTEKKAVPAGEKKKTEDELRAEQQTAWQKKLEDAEKRLQTFQDTKAALERELNGLAAYTTSRETLLKLIEDANKNIASAQSDIETLTNEGRQNGYSR